VELGVKLFWFCRHVANSHQRLGLGHLILAYIKSGAVFDSIRKEVTAALRRARGIQDAVMDAAGGGRSSSASHGMWREEQLRRLREHTAQQDAGASKAQTQLTHLQRTENALAEDTERDAGLVIQCVQALHSWMDLIRKNPRSKK
jgi:hypothetical protein